MAPGTFGSAAALPLFVLLSQMSPPLYGLTWLTLVFLGIWAADTAERAFARKDDGRIVIDEVVGQLLTLAPLVVLEQAGSLPLVVTGFVAFRVFDVWKPGPARLAERRFAGGTGVVLDDVVAGAFGAAVVAAAAAAGAVLGGGPA